MMKVALIFLVISGLIRGIVSIFNGNISLWSIVSTLSYVVASILLIASILKKTPKNNSTHHNETLQNNTNNSESRS